MSALVRASAAAALALALAVPAHAQAPSGSTVARVTSYCLTGRTASNTPVRPGVVATDPRVIPLGSTLTIEGLDGLYVAEDTGGGVHGAHVDLWLGDCGEAIRWGSQYRFVEWWGP